MNQLSKYDQTVTAMQKKSLIAMSGGVDSSVAAYLTQEQGLICTGAIARFFFDKKADVDRYDDYHTHDDSRDARSAADQLGIPFYVFDFTDCFSERVIKHFIEAYERGETPNPCINCNKHLKFGKLMQRAFELEMDKLVTGHYARIECDDTGRFLLKKGVDTGKDQSYVLYTMTQEQLSHTLFPLGNLHKTEVRKIAESQGLINTHKHESQDICFVPDGNYAAFIKKHSKHTFPEGNIYDLNGKLLGTHKGIIHYTIGQRRGIGISSSASYYVCEIHADTNEIVVGEEHTLYSDTLFANDINLIAYDRLESPIRAMAKIRYRHQQQPATVVQSDDNTLKIVFDTPQRAITRGQAVVLYEGDSVVGGGIIV